MIPKIIHQIWIGPKPAPTKFMDTWKDKNPEFTYIRWNEEEIKTRLLKLRCIEKIQEIEEMCGKADILRLEILYQYGGIYIDADSICIEPIDDLLMNTKAFASYEHEEIRKGLISNGTIGFPAKHPLLKKALDWIENNEVSQKKTGKRAWMTVGPTLLTKMYNTGLFKDVTIFPSYFFIPIHYTNREYKGHGKIYAYQEWGSSKQNYEVMNKIRLPEQFNNPDFSITILMPFYNGNAVHLKQCFESIKHQEGCFYIDFIIINDGSDKISTQILKKMLDNLQQTSRWINIHYVENEKNMGLGYSLNKGVVLSNNEFIFRMDSDDIMITNRIMKQLEFMAINKECVLCGTQIKLFKAKSNDNINFDIINETNHPSIDWETFCKKKPQWLMNHPTFCFKKSAIVDVGNYDSSQHSMCEDFDLIIRVMKKYGKIHNLPEVLLLYRIHENQLTWNGGKEGRNYWTKHRNKLIEKYMSENKQIGK
jgi:glycosyltransferase involved in cell wall biosynthesis